MKTREFPENPVNPVQQKNMDFSSVRNEFPIKRNRIYLNNASIAPMSNPVIAAVNAFMADVRDNGRNNYPQWCKHADHDIKGRIADLIGAHKSEIAFIKNTTEGILIVANGIDWQPDDNVIIADIEYPSNVYCWMNLKKRGSISSGSKPDRAALSSMMLQP